MKLVPYGLYKVKDEYFLAFRNPRFVDNKNEARPYYLAVKEKNGIIWLLPISSQVTKYKGWIAKDKQKFGNCIKAHIIQFMQGERAVLICNMIPVTEKYILGEFTINNAHYIVRDQNAIREIHTKCSKYLSLVRAGKMHPPVDILQIEKALLGR